MKDTKKIEDVANFIIEKNATIKECAEHFECSERTIQNYINKDLKVINPELYKLVKEKQEELIKKGQKNGGKIGVRGPIYTKEQMTNIAKTMVKCRMTLEEAEKKFGIPKSSIYEGIERIDDENLKIAVRDLFSDNKTINKRK